MQILEMYINFLYIKYVHVRTHIHNIMNFISIILIFINIYAIRCFIAESISWRNLLRRESYFGHITHAHAILLW